MRDDVYAAIEEGFKYILIEGDNKIIMQVEMETRQGFPAPDGNGDGDG